MDEQSGQSGKETPEEKISIDKVLALADLLRSITEWIRWRTFNHPLGGLPAGELYAHLASGGLDQRRFERCLSIIVGSGLVEERGNHLLVFTGPNVPPRQMTKDEQRMVVVFGNS